MFMKINSIDHALVWAYILPKGFFVAIFQRGHKTGLWLTNLGLLFSLLR